MSRLRRIFFLRRLLLPLLLPLFRIKLPCVCTITILLGVMEGLIYQIHASRQYDCNGARYFYPSLHIDLGFFDLGIVRSVGSICFCIHINLDRVSVCHTLLHHQDTTLTSSLYFPAVRLSICLKAIPGDVSIATVYGFSNFLILSTLFSSLFDYFFPVSLL